MKRKCDPDGYEAPDEYMTARFCTFPPSFPPLPLSAPSYPTFKMAGASPLQVQLALTVRGCFDAPSLVTRPNLLKLEVGWSSGLFQSSVFQLSSSSLQIQSSPSMGLRTLRHSRSQKRVLFDSGPVVTLSSESLEDDYWTWRRDGFGASFLRAIILCALSTYAALA